jgi:hypothetical protein
VLVHPSHYTYHVKCGLSTERAVAVSCLTVGEPHGLLLVFVDKHWGEMYRTKKYCVRERGNLQTEPTVSSMAKELFIGRAQPDSKLQHPKRTTPGIPTWSPTVVLTRPDDA